MERRRWIGVVLAAAAAAMGPAHAQGGFPNKEIQLLVGFAPGGSEDLRARGIAQKLSKILGQSVVVVNRAGASGAIALQQLAKAPPDGYTLGSVSASPMAFSPHLQQVGYTPGDFTYLAGSATQPFCICVRQDAQWKSMAELLDYAKKNPGKLSYAHPGTGHQSHVIVEAVNKAAGVKLAGIPYKGDADSITALLGGHVEIASLASTFVPHARAGKLRPLAMIGETRLKLYPDVPTLKELGFTQVNLKAPAVLGYAAPRGLPADVQRKLEGAFAEAIRSQEFAELLAKLDNEPYYRDGATFAAQVNELYTDVGKMLKELGL